MFGIKDTRIQITDEDDNGVLGNVYLIHDGKREENLFEIKI